MSKLKGNKKTVEPIKLVDDNILSDVLDDDDEIKTITLKVSDLQILIRKEVLAAVKLLNEDISERFDNTDLEIEKLFNHVRNENKSLKAQLLKITTTIESKPHQSVQINDELSAIRSSLDNLKTIPLNSQVELISDKKNYACWCSTIC